MLVSIIAIASATATVPKSAGRPGLTADINEPTGLFTRCKECGCPIKKKVFSDDFNDCPLGKWEEVDSEYFPPRKKVTTLF